MGDGPRTFVWHLCLQSVNGRWPQDFRLAPLFANKRTTLRAGVYNVEKICIKTTNFGYRIVTTTSCRVRSGLKGNHKRHLRSETRASDRTITRTRPRVLTASTQTNLKASTTAQYHVHAHPAVGITSTEPGRKARPCKPGGRARPREIFETKTQTITKRKSRHAFDPLTHGLRSLRFRYASYRKRELLEVLRAVPDAWTSTEIRLVPVSRVQQMQDSRTFGTRM